jgi:sorbitol/mannitol transport system permease protein
MARAIPARRRWLLTLLAWAVGLVIFFPILWTLLTSFKTEGEAISTPPHFFFFRWTLENYAEVQQRSNYVQHVTNSVVISLGSTVIGLLIGVPAAWAAAFAPIPAVGER